MAKRRSRGAREIIEADLNIMPLMNLFVVLIPMLLLSAVFVELSVLELNLPTGDESAEKPKRGLELMVEIGPEHYVVKGRRLKTQRIPRDTEDATALNDALASIAQAHPDNQDLTILSRENTPYQDIITVMDASHEAGVPGISLGQSSIDTDRVAR